MDYTFPASDTYRLAFEVTNHWDNALPSYIGVDRVALVPLPAAVLLGMLALGVAGLRLRKLV